MKEKYWLKVYQTNKSHTINRSRNIFIYLVCFAIYSKNYTFPFFMNFKAFLIWDGCIPIWSSQFLTLSVDHSFTLLTLSKESIFKQLIVIFFKPLQDSCPLPEVVPFAISWFDSVIFWLNKLPLLVDLRSKIEYNDLAAG